jgi:nitrite reductase/ring-hydroxylating ferredoxin subunit
MNDSRARDANHSCDACPVAGAIERRAFLRDGFSGILVAVGALGIGTARASAMSVAFARGHGARTDKVYPIPAADGVVIDKDESVIIARFDGKVFAFSLACPHQNTALRWDKGNKRFKCPKHESRYQPDGTFIDGRATRSMDRFAIKRDGEQVSVNLDALYREDENQAEWSRAVILLSEK